MSGPVSQPMLIAATLATLCVIGIVDYLTGYEISFAVFYLVPVAIAAWWGNRALAVMVGLLSAAVWYAAEVAAGYPYSQAWIPVWNASVRLAFFLIVGILLNSMRGKLANEKVLAETDPLTRLLNRRAFFSRLKRGLQDFESSGQPLTVAYIDLDNFKSINDNHGHSEGDRVLREFARTLHDTMRESDTVARIGGDEFALVLPSTDVSGAQFVVSMLGQRLERQVSGARPVICSIGAIVFVDPPASAEEAMQLADSLMYRAKEDRSRSTHIVGKYTQSRLDIVSTPLKRAGTTAGDIAAVENRRQISIR